MLTATANWLAANHKYEKQLVFRILISGYGRTFSDYDTQATDLPWIVSIDEHNKNINDLEGGADQETLNFTLQDRNNVLTADMGRGTVFEGKQITLQVGFTTLASLSDYLTLWVGFIDQVDSTNSNTEYHFQCSDITSQLARVVYQTADNGASTSGQNIKTVKGNPIDIMLDVLLSQAKINPALVDIAKLQAFRDGPFQGMEFLFRLQQAPAAIDFIKNQLLKPLGGYLWVTQGKLTANFFYPLNQATAVQSLGENDWLTIPAAEQTAMINTVQFQFDKDDAGSSSGGNYNSQSTQEYGPSVLKYGIYGEHVVSSDGMRAGLQGYLIAFMIARLIFGRYGFKNLKFDANASEGLWTDLLLEPGDIVSVTHQFIPDRQAGVMGITNKLFEILNKKINFASGLVTLTMIDASYLTQYGFFKITSNTEAAYTSASSGDKATLMFQTADNGKYSNGNPGNPLG